MKPILLNDIEEELIFGDQFSGLTDESNLGLTIFGHGLCLGIHKTTGKFVTMERASPTHNIVYCLKSICVPVEVDTYGKLREWCVGQIKLKREREIRRNILWGFMCQMQPKARLVFEEAFGNEFP